MFGLGVCVVAVLPITASAAPVPTVPTAPPAFVIGVDDDLAKWLTRPDGLVAKYQDLGIDAVRLTIRWRHGQPRPTRVRVYLHRAALLIQRGQRVVISVFGRPSDAPLDDASRAQYCDFLHYVFLRIPFRHVAIWNEANSPQFWPSSAGAPAHEKLLATCWSRLHALRRDVNLISTTAAHYDPARECLPAERSSEADRRHLRARPQDRGTGRPRGEPDPRRASSRTLSAGGGRVLQLRAPRRGPARRVAVGRPLSRRDGEAVVRGIQVSCRPGARGDR